MPKIVDSQKLETSRPKQFLLHPKSFLKDFTAFWWKFSKSVSLLTVKVRKLISSIVWQWVKIVKSWFKECQNSVSGVLLTC